MAQKNTGYRRKQSEASSKRNILIIVASVVVLLAVALLVLGRPNDRELAQGGGKDIVIPKSAVTEDVSFYPVKVGSTSMEVLAVRASDGSIRTAFNTCQICNGSPRAYYQQEGDLLVCQNCGNQFSMDQVAVERGGCNPVPILSDEKTENDDTIIISADFLAQNKGLFTDNWKTR